MGRWAGIDYGSKRLGLALANHGNRIASPAGALPATGTLNGDADAILKWAQLNEVGGFVVGLPLNMDGTDSQQTRLARALAEALARRGQRPVQLWDERLTTYQADEYLDAAGLRPGRRKRLRDAIAAQIILQSFLDACHRGEAGPDAAPGQP